MKKRYVQIDRPDIGRKGYITPIADIDIAVESELANSEEGEELVLTIVEMTDEEVTAATEFTGW